MIISGDANGQDISSQTLFRLGGLSVADYPLQDQVRQFNAGQRIIWAIIFKINGWQLDDRNQSNLPIATTSLNAGQLLYAIPGNSSISLSIRGLRVSDANGNWTEVNPITEEEIINKYNSNVRAFQTTLGIPKFYRPVGQTFFLYPGSNVTIASGMEMSFDRSMIEIAYNASNTTPGFDSTFHEALAVYAALQYCQAYPKGLGTRIAGLQQEWISYVGDQSRGLVGSIERFYNLRWGNQKKRLEPARENNK